MHQQRQTHQLGETWRAEDHADRSQRSAYAAKQYYQLITEQMNVIEARFAQHDQEIYLLKQENRQLKSASHEPRNQAVIWGIGSAVIASLVVALALTPSNAPKHVEKSSAITFQFGGQ